MNYYHNGTHINVHAKPQSSLKEKETERQINKMLESKVIKESQAPWCSQVHLTPKPKHKWHFMLTTTIEKTTARLRVGQSRMYTV